MLKSLSAPVSPWLKARTLRDKRAVTKKVLSLPSECGSCAVCTCRCSAEVQPTLAAKCNMRNTRPRSQKAWARTLTNILLPRHYIPLHLEKLAEWQCNASRCNLKGFRPLVGKPNHFLHNKTANFFHNRGQRWTSFGSKCILDALSELQFELYNHAQRSWNHPDYATRCGHCPACLLAKGER